MLMTTSGNFEDNKQGSFPEAVDRNCVNENAIGDDADDSSIDVAFASLDMTGVDFDAPAVDDGNDDHHNVDGMNAALVLQWERQVAFSDFNCFVHGEEPEDQPSSEGSSSYLERIRELGGFLASGRYADALDKSRSAADFLRGCSETIREALRDARAPAEPITTASAVVRRQVWASVAAAAALRSDDSSIPCCVELELLGVAALNLFLQCNYTGPSIEGSLPNNHKCFSELFRRRDAETEESSGPDKEEDTKMSRDGDDNIEDEERKESPSLKLTTPRRNEPFQNAILSELAVDGEWPCPVCHSPYLLLLARSIFTTLAAAGEVSPLSSPHSAYSPPPARYVRAASRLTAVHLWRARSAVAHQRLLPGLGRQPSACLWKEVEGSFSKCLDLFPAVGSHPNDSDGDDGDSPARFRNSSAAATVALEWGLALHHFDRPGRGKKFFRRAQELAGLRVEVTGATGKRTKFQHKATAQMLVKATSSSSSSSPPLAAVASSDHSVKQALPSPDGEKNGIQQQQQRMIQHSEDEILLEKIQFEEDSNNQATALTALDQAILLALCLDVKNSNPSGDDLTAEEMGAFLARVLENSGESNWMVYSTALLERAWLEFERSHARERSLLQLQALADQHTSRLTLTQSTQKCVDESAPAQDRLAHLHCLVYPPRWEMLEDLADRYAALGLVVSAAELYAEIGSWDDAVDCYRRAGRTSTAEPIVRERLAMQETPRLWSALGDLTGDPEHYQRAVELSGGNYARAHTQLGHRSFQEGDLETAAAHYRASVKVRPLQPGLWFRLGTAYMRLCEWDKALAAFSEVVQQEPEEGEAWANVAAVHMHNRRPERAYPALQESLKYRRNDWRVWTSHLYACLDLAKYDEAVHACDAILDIQKRWQGQGGGGGQQRQQQGSIEEVGARAAEAPHLEEKCVRAIVGGVLTQFHQCNISDGNVNGNGPPNASSLESWRRSLSRVHALLERIAAGSDAEPWVFETLSFFHEQTGAQDRKVLDSLMREYRSLLACRQGWEKDNRACQKICQVSSHVANIHRRTGDRESLSKAKFLVRGVVAKIRAARPDDGDANSLPDEVGRLERLLVELEEALEDLPQCSS